MRALITFYLVCEVFCTNEFDGEIKRQEEESSTWRSERKRERWENASLCVWVFVRGSDGVCVSILFGRTCCNSKLWLCLSVIRVLAGYRRIALWEYNVDYLSKKQRQPLRNSDWERHSARKQKHGIRRAAGATCTKRRIIKFTWHDITYSLLCYCE